MRFKITGLLQGLFSVPLQWLWFQVLIWRSVQEADMKHLRSLFYGCSFCQMRYVDAVNRFDQRDRLMPWFSSCEQAVNKDFSNPASVRSVPETSIIRSVNTPPSPGSSIIICGGMVSPSWIYAMCHLMPHTDNPRKDGWPQNSCRRACDRKAAGYHRCRILLISNLIKSDVPSARAR